MSTKWEDLHHAEINNNASYIKEQTLVSENDRLVKKITSRLWISKQVTYELVLNKTIISKSDLKKELLELNLHAKDKEKINSLIANKSELKEIFEELNSLKFLEKENQQQDTKMRIADLRDWIQLEKSDKYEIASNSYAVADKLFSPELLNKIENPEHIWHHLAWAAIWSIDLTYTARLLWKDLIMWIVKTPVDIYKIARWKAEIDSFKNV